jgi:wyosine [tRNA(Phe)-imidazoG37] synthetase (radical SAM superfamily)
MKYLFGPVNSRRLGISLGVDLVPYKTCSLNCVYCECGETSTLTSAIAEYVPTDEVIAELDGYLAGSPRLDAVTFSGSGEPTLHAGIGKIISHLKDVYPQYTIAVLTNGTMLHDPDVRRAISGADIVVPSLDAVGAGAFDRICRPAGGITPEKVVEGLIEFRKEFPGKLYLEIFIVPGINDDAGELAKLKEACLAIKPDTIQINSLDRPGAEGWVEPLGRQDLVAIRDFFRPLDAEIIGKPAPRVYGDRRTLNLVKSVMSILRRRPSTIDDLLPALGAERKELLATLEGMAKSGLITVEKLERGEFYRIV